MLCLAATSCSDKSQPSVASAPLNSDGSVATLNIRYVDMDSINANYNLAKDFQELYLRSLSKLDNAQQSKAAEIQRFGSQIEQKMRSNGYLSEESYNADVQRFNKMQQDAQQALAAMEREAQQELAQQQQQLLDSINSFIESFNATRGYDAILLRAAGLYFNPQLDITAEVVEGLNARYNRVASSK